MKEGDEISATQTHLIPNSLLKNKLWVVYMDVLGKHSGSTKLSRSVANVEKVDQFGKACHWTVLKKQKWEEQYNRTSRKKM